MEGGAFRRGSEAPALMSAKREIQAQARSDGKERASGLLPKARRPFARRRVLLGVAGHLNLNLNRFKAHRAEIFGETALDLKILIVIGEDSSSHHLVASRERTVSWPTTSALCRVPAGR